jgi:hypothetical protein
LGDALGGGVDHDTPGRPWRRVARRSSRDRLRGRGHDGIVRWRVTVESGKVNEQEIASARRSKRFHRMVVGSRLTSSRWQRALTTETFAPATDLCRPFLIALHHRLLLPHGSSASLPDQTGIGVGAGQGSAPESPRACARLGALKPRGGGRKG